MKKKEKEPRKHIDHEARAITMASIPMRES